MAPGVKGDFEKAAPRLWGFPKWGETTAGVVKGIAGASVAAGSLTAQTLGGVANSSIGGRIARTALGQMLGVGRTQTRPTLPTIDLDEINPDFL
jgi:hypothetical protein